MAIYAFSFSSRFLEAPHVYFGRAMTGEPPQGTLRTFPRRKNYFGAFADIAGISFASA